MAQMLLERHPTTDQMDAMWNLRQEKHDICTVKSILIVEDNTALGNLLWEILQEETTCKVFLVPSAEAALNTLQMVTPQLFLLDYCLPGMDGLELVDRIRDIAGCEQTPILLMSAALPQGNIAKQHLRCLPKPFDLDSLLQMVAELLAI